MKNFSNLFWLGFRKAYIAFGNENDRCLLGGSNGIDEIIKVNLPWGVYHHSLGDFFNGMDNKYKFFKAPSYTFIKMAETKEGLNKWKVLETLLVLREIEHNHIDNDGYFPASKKRLIQLTHLHPATLYKALQQLEEDGYITRQSIPFKGNNRQPVKYLINYGKFDEDNSISWNEISAWLREDGYSDETLSMGCQNEPHKETNGYSSETLMGLQNEPHMGLQNEPHMGLQNEPHRDDYGVQNGTTLSYLFKSDYISDLNQTNLSDYIEYSKLLPVLSVLDRNAPLPCGDDEKIYLPSKEMLSASLEEKDKLELNAAWVEGLLHPKKKEDNKDKLSIKKETTSEGTYPPSTKGLAVIPATVPAAASNHFPVKDEWDAMDGKTKFDTFKSLASRTGNYLYKNETRLGSEPYSEYRDIVRGFYRQFCVPEGVINHFISNCTNCSAEANLDWRAALESLRAA